jgi:hypothetical protein
MSVSNILGHKLQTSFFQLKHEDFYYRQIPPSEGIFLNNYAFHPHTSIACHLGFDKSFRFGHLIQIGKQCVKTQCFE